MTTWPAVVVTVPRARGRRPDGQRTKGTFAALVTGVDRGRAGRAAILGERVQGTVLAPIGALLLVYGEDCAMLDGRLLFHCIDLYRVDRVGRLTRLDFGTLEPGDWLAPVLDSITAHLPDATTSPARTPRPVAAP